MSKTLVATVVTPGVTYTTTDGTPYRADDTGIIHMTAAHLVELAAKTPPAGCVAPSAATAAQVGATWHRGAPTSITVG